MPRIPASILFLSLTTQAAHAQFAPPKGFHLVKGENGAGDDDVYTNGRYSFDTHKLLQGDFDYKGNNAALCKYLARFFGFPFYLTKDSICWGTGRQGNNYEYVVVGRTDFQDIELYSPYNDAGFAQYSTWLLNTTRAYDKMGKSMIFPFHNMR